MDSKKLFGTYPLLRSVLFALLLVSAMSVLSFADDLPESGITEIGQAAQTEMEITVSSAAEPEQPEADAPPQTSENEVPVVQDEQFDPFNVSSPEDEESEQDEAIEQAAIFFDDYEYETLLTLKSIEYQLKIIAGGTVLAVCCAFTWFTILKPIKNFTRV